MKSSANNAGRIRPAAVAGRFYPADPSELRAMVEQFIGQVRPDHAAKIAPKAVIAPHAGYVYSGPIAASAHARFAPDRRAIQRIVLIGPSHYESVDGLAVSSAAAFSTPLGPVPVDTDAVRQLSGLQHVSVCDEAHAREHSLEVHLPFLKVILENFSIVPLVVGDATDEFVARVLEALWDGAETRVVVSSDLSHYHNYETARELDSMTSRAVEELRARDIGEEQACGLIPVRGLLHLARRRGLHARTIDLRNSGDTAGPRDRVVGYGAFVFEEGSNATKSSAQINVEQNETFNIQHSTSNIQ